MTPNEYARRMREAANLDDMALMMSEFLDMEPTELNTITRDDVMKLTAARIVEMCDFLDIPLELNPKTKKATLVEKTFDYIFAAGLVIAGPRVKMKRMSHKLCGHPLNPVEREKCRQSHRAELAAGDALQAANA